MNIPVSRQIPAPPSQPPTPERAKPSREPDDDFAPDRLGAAPGEEDIPDTDPRTQHTD